MPFFSRFPSMPPRGRASYRGVTFGGMFPSLPISFATPMLANSDGKNQHALAHPFNRSNLVMLEYLHEATSVHK